MTAIRQRNKVSGHGSILQSSLLVVGARVRSFDPRARSTRRDAPANAVLCRDGRVVAVGRADAIRAPDAEILDLPGATLTPGLTDAHIHLTEWALARRQVELSDATSPREAARRIGEHGRPGADGWIRGRGWNTRRWAGAEPDRGTLDAVMPRTPVVLQSQDMHALWVNTAALDRAGIGTGTLEPAGGRIVRDANGEPTGLLLESASQLVARCIPAPSETEMLEAVADAQACLHRLGVTGVHSLPGILVPRPDPLSILETLKARGNLRLRVLQHMALDDFEDAIRLGLRSGLGDDWIRVGGVKMFLDGALGSRTAWMREPYEGTADHGISTLPADAFRDAVRGAAAAGLASTVHAIGDAAVALAIDVLADPSTRVRALPHRIEHVQCLPDGSPDRMTDEDVIARTLASAAPDRIRASPAPLAAMEGAGTRHRLATLARAGIIGSVQPAHLISDWQAADRHWGADRARRTYAFRSLLDAGVVLACGSDAPVEPVDPRLGLFAATTRTDLDRNPTGGWQPAERISMADAFRGYTVGPAVAAGRPGLEGQLTPGAFADIVAWNADPMEDGRDPLDLTCVATIVGGEVVSNGSNG